MDRAIYVPLTPAVIHAFLEGWSRTGLPTQGHHVMLEIVQNPRNGVFSLRRPYQRAEYHGRGYPEV